MSSATTSAKRPEKIPLSKRGRQFAKQSRRTPFVPIHPAMNELGLKEQEQQQEQEQQILIQHQQLQQQLRQIPLPFLILSRRCASCADCQCQQGLSAQSREQLLQQLGFDPSQLRQLNPEPRPTYDQPLPQSPSVVAPQSEDEPAVQQQQATHQGDTNNPVNLEQEPEVQQPPEQEQEKSKTRPRQDEDEEDLVFPRIKIVVDKTKKKLSPGAYDQASALNVVDEHIEEIRPMDIVSGRDNNTKNVVPNGHVGNKMFRQAIRDALPAYKECTRAMRAEVVLDVVQKLQEAGCRFIQVLRMGKNPELSTLKAKQIRDKVSSAFRNALKAGKGVRHDSSASFNDVDEFEDVVMSDSSSTRTEAEHYRPHEGEPQAPSQTWSVYESDSIPLSSSGDRHYREVYGSDRQNLEDNYEPGPKTVVFREGSEQSLGNRRLRSLIDLLLEDYDTAETPEEKTDMVGALVDLVYHTSGGDYEAFVIHENGKWQSIGVQESIARVGAVVNTVVKAYMEGMDDCD